MGLTTAFRRSSRLVTLGALIKGAWVTSGDLVPTSYDFVDEAADALRVIAAVASLEDLVKPDLGGSEWDANAAVGDDAQRNGLPPWEDDAGVVIDADRSRYAWGCPLRDRNTGNALTHGDPGAATN